MKQRASSGGLDWGGGVDRIEGETKKEEKTPTSTRVGGVERLSDEIGCGRSKEYRPLDTVEQGERMSES